MPQYNFQKMSTSEIEKAILELRAETEAIKKEAEAKSLKNKEEIDAIKKEAEAIKKEAEARRRKNQEEIDTIKKETEAIKKEAEAIKKEAEATHLKNQQEIDAIRKQGEEEHKKNLIDIDILRKERETIEKKLQSTMDGLGFNMGASSEELFANSIEKTMEIAGSKFYKMLKNYIVANKAGDNLSEIDIVLFNKNYICIIEVKHHAKIEDITKLTEKTVPNFIENETKYKKYIVLPFLAGLSFQKNVIEHAKQKQVGLLKYRGEHFKVVNKI